MTRWIWIPTLVALLGGAVALDAAADESASRILVREGYSGPITGPTIPEGRTYYRAGRVPKGPPIESPWRVFIAAYMYGSSIDGTAYDDGVEEDISVDFGDLFGKLHYALQTYVEVGYKRWSFGLDATFIGLGKALPQEGEFLPSFELDQVLLDFRFGYTVWCKHLGVDPWGCCLYPRRLHLDAIAGVRYWNLHQTLDIRTVGVPTLSRQSREQWADPYVGARLRYPFARRWGFNLYGDIGGFGIENGSELTWQVQGLLYFKLTRQLQIGLGYRVLDVDRVTGTGNAREGIDATYHGPIVGLGFHF